MKFLIDADCPRSIGTALEADGHTVRDIRDLIPSATDGKIYDLIKRDGFILITRDTDFANILRYPATTNCGIILLRTYLLTPPEMISQLKSLLGQVTERDLLGAITVVKRGRYRIHRI